MHLLRRPMSHYFLSTGLYFLLAFILPANRLAMQNYHLTAVQYHVLLFVIILPVLGIWFAAFFGYEKLRAYAFSIRSSAEGDDYAQLAYGCGWLAYALPIPAIVSILLNAYANNHPTGHAGAVIISNYINLLLPLVAFSLLSSGAQNLTAHTKLRLTLGRARSIIILFIILGVFYCFLTFRHFDLLSFSSSDNAYYLPVWLAVLTVVIPYLYSWFVGLLAAYEIVLFAQEARGLLYRRALILLGGGIAAVIGSSIAMQYLSSVMPRSGAVSLNSILAFIYIIEIISAIGYTLIAFGAMRLKKIEEV